MLLAVTSLSFLASSIKWMGSIFGGAMAILLLVFQLRKKKGCSL
jgi:hypothetical protein